MASPAQQLPPGWAAEWSVHAPAFTLTAVVDGDPGIKMPNATFSLVSPASNPVNVFV